jgi:hypothetical protein
VPDQNIYLQGFYTSNGQLSTPTQYSSINGSIYIDSNKQYQVTSLSVKCKPWVNNQWRCEVAIDLDRQYSGTVDIYSKACYSSGTDINNVVVVLGLNSQPSCPSSYNNDITVDQSQTSFTNPQNIKFYVTFKDLCFLAHSTNRNACEADKNCKWVRGGSTAVTYHCYENPINVRCDTPPITIGTVQYTCTADQSGCYCIGSDGSIIK